MAAKRSWNFLLVLGKILKRKLYFIFVHNLILMLFVNILKAINVLAFEAAIYWYKKLSHL